MANYLSHSKSGRRGQTVPEASHESRARAKWGAGGERDRKGGILTSYFGCLWALPRLLRKMPSAGSRDGTRTDVHNPPEQDVEDVWSLDGQDMNGADVRCPHTDGHNGASCTAAGQADTWIGVDLGTTNTSAAVWHEEKSRAKVTNNHHRGPSLLAPVGWPRPTRGVRGHATGYSNLSQVPLVPVRCALPSVRRLSRL